MNTEYTVVIEQDEAGYYVAEVPELYWLSHPGKIP